MSFDQKVELVMWEAERLLQGRLRMSGWHSNYAGSVSSALICTNGKMYSGVNVCVACDMGFCAEQNAIGEMLKDRNTEIELIVAIHEEQGILPPCGKCREFMSQVDNNNENTRVIMPGGGIAKLGELLPYNWNRADRE